MTLSEKLSAYDTTLPFERARPLPDAWFSDPEIHEHAIRSIFRNSWQVIARRDQCAQPGSFVTAHVGGVPVLLWRGHDDVLRVMENVCSHARAILESRPEGVLGRTLPCWNHRATYREDGTLQAMPDCQNIDALRASGVCLPQFAVGECGPFVAVHLGEIRASLQEILSPLPPWCSDALEQVRFHDRKTYEVPYNWMKGVENYEDNCSHCPSVHCQLSSALSHTQRRIEQFPLGNLQCVPFKVSDDPTVAAVRSGAHEAYFFWFWPNFMINFNGDGVVDTNRFDPLGPDRCRVVIDTYYHPEKSASFREQSSTLTDMIQQEDNAACRSMQMGASSPLLGRGFYSVPNDVLVHQFHQMVAKALQEGLEKEGESSFPGRCIR